MFNDYCRKGQFVGNVAFGYDLLKTEILKRFSKEIINDVISWEIEEHRKYIELLEKTCGPDFQEFAHNDLPVDRNNPVVKLKSKDRVVKMLFDQLKQNNESIEQYLPCTPIPKQ